jgi:hypothetical protein
MKKPSTMPRCRNGNVRHGQLTIGLDLGDRSSFYCVLNGAGEVILEARVATNPEAMKKIFEKMPRRCPRAHQAISRADHRQIRLRLNAAMLNRRELLSGSGSIGVREGC